MTKSSRALLLISLPVLGLAACGEVNAPATGVPDTGVPDTGMDPPTDLPDTGVPDGIPDSSEPALPRNLMFVTSTTMTGAIGSREVADTICSNLARDAGKPGTYLAYLSTTGQGAAARFQNVRGWVRADGQPFADDVATLVGGTTGPFTPARLDETGQPVPPPINIWTATRSGNYYPDYGNCVNWTATTQPTGEAAHAAAGDATLGGTAFQFASNQECTARLRLLCMQVDHDNAVTPPPATDHKLAFVTTEKFPGTSGIAGADALCQKEATDHGKTGRFRALLATGGASAASRFRNEGPWKRVDGMPITKPGVSLFDESAELLAPINVDLNGRHYGVDNVWVGAATLSATPTSMTTTCSDWTGTGGTQGRYAGQVSRGAINTPCGVARHLLCLETAQ